MTNTFSDLESEFKIDDIYTSFKLLLVTDLNSSACVSKNGLHTLLMDVMHWMFRSHPVKVPAVIGRMVKQISLPESSFVSKLELQSDGSYIMVWHVHNYPSWLVKGSFKIVKHFF